MSPGRFPPPPQYGFQGRARELYELERQFRQPARHRAACHGRHGQDRARHRGRALVDAQRPVPRRRVLPELRAVRQRRARGAGARQLLRRAEVRPASRRRAAPPRHRVLPAERAVLMVWDNFESALPQFNDGAAAHGSPYTDEERRRLAELFRDLTTGPGSGCLLVTCRPGDTGLPGARRYELQGLARADSLWLLASILKRDGLTLSDPAADAATSSIRCCTIWPIIRSRWSSSAHICAPSRRRRSARTSASCSRRSSRRPREAGETNPRCSPRWNSPAGTSAPPPARPCRGSASSAAGCSRSICST